MTDSHLHLYPHQYPDRPSDFTVPTGAYPLDRIERYVEAAAISGVTELAFTEHLYRCVEAAAVLGDFWEQEADPVRAQTRADVQADRTLSLERYVDVILRAKDAGFPIQLGLEVDFFPETIDAVLEFLRPYPFDVLIGSVHWIGGWWFDRRDAVAEWERRGTRRAYEQYFRLETALAASGAVDVLAHPDRIKFQGHALPEPPRDLYRELVSAAVASGVAIELSSAGLRHPVGEIYPAPDLLEMCHTAGLDITFASDAHRPDQAAWRFDELRTIAINAGFTHTVRFAARRRFRQPIERGLPD